MTRPQEATRKARTLKLKAKRSQPVEIGGKRVFVSRRVVLTVVDLDSSEGSATKDSKPIPARH